MNGNIKYTTLSPHPNDSIETLEKKYNDNINAAWGAIAVDFVIDSPGDISGAADYQANALAAKEMINQKKNNK